MIKEASLKYLIYNGKIYSTDRENISNKSDSISIYEVIRIVDGIPLYLKEHLVRLKKSAGLLDMEIDKGDGELTEEIMRLVEINRGYNFNIKILCCGRGKKIEDIYLYFIESFYPPRSMYEEGVHTILYKTQRENPNAKTYNYRLRQRINIELKERNAFEALLVNDREQITEGSRSNVFFVKGKKLLTSPANRVLLGVTRTKIMELCRLYNIDIIEEEITLDRLREYDGAFITGTSADVLPIKKIDEIEMNSSKNNIVIEVMEIYERDKNDYILKRKNKAETDKGH